jgi:hypothetical protein
MCHQHCIALGAEALTAPNFDKCTTTGLALGLPELFADSVHCCTMLDADVVPATLPSAATGPTLSSPATPQP